MKIKYAIVIILLLLQPLLAQMRLWDEVFSGTGSFPEQVNDATIDNNLNVYVTGLTSWSSSATGNDITTIKYDKDGDTLWTNTLDVYGYRDEAYSICLDDSGNAYVAGYAKDASNNKYLVVIKYDGDSGDTVWCNSELIQNPNQYDYKIAVDDSYDVYVATDSLSLCWLLKFEGDDGAIAWTKHVYEYEYDNAYWYDMVLDTAGYIYVGGTAFYGKETETEAILVAKYWSTGDREWLSEYGHNRGSGCEGIDIDNYGYTYVTGTSHISGRQCVVIVKYDNNGDTVWSYYDNETNNCVPRDIEVFRLTGESYITGWVSRGTVNNNVLTIAVDASGDTIWTHEYGGSSRDAGYELGIGTYCVYVGGYTSSDMLTLCYRRNNGYLEWAETYDSAKSYNIAVRPAPIPHASYITHIVSAGRKANDWVTLMYKYDESIMRSPSSGPQDSKTQLVKFFSFEKLYPNPARDILKIRFNSPDERKITIKLYDAAGRLVKDIFDGNAKIGMNEISYESKNLPDGVYFVRLETANYRVTEKVIYQN